MKKNLLLVCFSFLILGNFTSVTENLEIKIEGCSLNIKDSTFSSYIHINEMENALNQSYDKKRRERIWESKRKMNLYYFDKYGMMVRGVGYHKTQTLCSQLSVNFHNNISTSLFYRGIKIDRNTKFQELFENDNLKPYYDKSIYADLDNPNKSVIRFISTNDVNLYIYFTINGSEIKSIVVDFCSLT
jgi:hypothetical protein